MASIENLKAFDPFSDINGNDDSTITNYVHVRVQQRNRKTLTTVQGIPLSLT